MVMGRAIRCRRGKSTWTLSHRAWKPAKRSEIGAEDMMAMLDLIDNGSELAAVPAVQAGAEGLGNPVGGEPPQAEFTTSLEQLVDGKIALENKVTAILDLADGIEA